MNTSIVLALDTRRAKTDGTYPLLMRIIHHGKPSPITLGIYLKEEDWDAEAKKIKSTFKGSESVTRLNNFLQKKKTAATDIILKLDEQGILDSLTVYEVKDLVERKRNRESFLQFGEDLRLELIKVKQIGNARTYKFCLSVLRRFMGGKDVAFSDLTYDMLKKFEIAHYAKGNKVNGLSTYMRTWRAIFNEGIRRGLVSQDLYPFKLYKIASEDTQKLAIERNFLTEMAKLELKHASGLFHARNYFLISFFTRGTSFFDMALLRVENVKGGRMRYKRQKTGKEYDVKITEEIEPIIQYYTDGKKEGDYLFPIVTEEDPEAQYKEIEWARKRYNDNLRELADRIGLEEDLTSRVSRHTFATLAVELGVEIMAIKEMLGHGSVKTTEIYVRGLRNAKLDSIHERINKG